MSGNQSNQVAEMQHNTVVEPFSTSNNGEYTVTININTPASVDELTAALQSHYDDGAATGSFAITTSDDGSRKIVFERGFWEDREMLLTGLGKGLSIYTAARRQLADELEEFNSGQDCITAVIMALRDDTNGVVVGIAEQWEMQETAVGLNQQIALKICSEYRCGLENVSDIKIDTEFGNVTATANGQKNVDAGFIENYGITLTQWVKSNSPQALKKLEEFQRTVTSRALAEQYAAKGSMPQEVVHQLYALREQEVASLSNKDVIAVSDLNDLDRGARTILASMLYFKCNAEVKHALLHDEHHHVRSAAILSRDESLQ